MNKKRIIINYIVWTILTVISFFLGWYLGCFLFNIKFSSPIEKPPERFITYHLDKTISHDFIVNGYYYIVDTETDNVYLRAVCGSNIGLTPLYDADGNLIKAKNLGITY